MKHKILWLGVSFLLVAALVLASCAPAVPGEQEEEEEEEEVVPGEQEEEEEEEEEEPAVGAPQYGGTLTCFNGRVSKGDPGSPWLPDGNWPGLLYLTPIQESPLVGDFLNRGPRGTDEFAYQMGNMIPSEFLTGQLLESWEVSTEKLVWHIRPGIHWAADNVDWMENREVTADDFVADLLAYTASPSGKAMAGPWTGNIYATDRYTVVIEFISFNIKWEFVLGWEDRAIFSPPELIDAGPGIWENQVGTGPFLFKEYSVGSYMSYKRNPNWWQTTVIDGKVYDDVPFIDEVVWPIIPDVATQIAALRTGKIDYYWIVPAEQWDHLDKTTPEIVSAKFPAAFGRYVIIQLEEPPFNSKEARRALRIGTDQRAFQRLYGRGAMPLHWHPLSSTHSESIYTPLEKLPPELQILYDYNPELASEMLRKAGIPEGFEVEYLVPVTAYNLDEAALLKDQWAKIGLDLKIKAVDSTTYFDILYNAYIKHTATSFGFSILNPIETYSGAVAWGHNAQGYWPTPEFEELVDKLLSTTDVDEQNRLIKEGALIWTEEAPIVPLNLTLDGTYWWPWIKNYYGEHCVRDNDYISVLAHAWIDEDLKAEMGY